MKKTLIRFSMLLLVSWAVPALAADSMSSHDQKRMDTMTDMKHMEGMKHGDTFEEKVVTDGIRAEFQIMSLASMNMKDEGGASHHIMTKFFDESDNHQIKDAIGKIKVISPEEKEQINGLKNYSGIYAANFTFDASGEYGIICLARIDGKDYVYKFWYPHH